MDFDYCDMEDYWLVTFNVKTVPFYAMVDKESKEVISIETLRYGKFFEHAYTENEPMKEMTYLPITYFEVENALKDFFANM